MRERYSLQTAELNSLRDQHFDREKTAEKLQVQQIQIDLMKSDFEAQRQELISVRARLSDATSMKILNASITNVNSLAIQHFFCLSGLRFGRIEQRNLAS